ncbi:MAG: acyltransferase family protein [Phycisphaerae bacterium]
MDVWRFIAAISVIWLHATDVSALTAMFRMFSVFAVPFFAASAAMLAARKGATDARTPLAAYAGGRLFRLYLPFFAWSAIYLVLRDTKHVLFHLPLLLPSVPLLISGAAGHLWFLPFIAVVTILAFSVGRACRKLPSRVLPATVLLLVAAASCFIACPVPYHHDGFGFLSALSWRAMPAAFAGVTVGWYLDKAKLVLGRGGPLLSAAFLAAAALLLTAQFLGGESVWMENLAGLLVLLAALGPPVVPYFRRFSAFGELAYGIYLVHIAFLQLAEAVLDHNHRVDVPWWQVLAAFSFTVAMSWASAALFLRWPFTRWLVGAAPRRAGKPAD